MPVSQKVIQSYTKHKIVHYCMVFRPLLIGSLIGQRLLRTNRCVAFRLSAFCRRVIGWLLSRLFHDFGFRNRDCESEATRARHSIF